MSHRITSSALVIAILSVGCHAADGERPLTPAEKADLIRAAEAQGLLKDLGSTRCGNPSKIAQLQARMNQFSGPDAFDSRNCPRQTDAAPPSVTK